MTLASFETREKGRQERFRNKSHTISDAGRSPSDDKGMRNGHLLAWGSEQENLHPTLRGETGAIRFMADRNIKWQRSEWSGDEKGRSGPTRNLAGSQIACINFLLPLAKYPDALVAILSSIDDDVVDAAVIEDSLVGTASLVELEWIGLSHALEGSSITTRGARSTSVDAFLVAKTTSGRRAYLLEWKYIEDYSTKQYLRGGVKGNKTRRQRYSEIYRHSPSFKKDVALEAWFYDPFYQIMRQRLLADRMVLHGELGVSDAKVVVVVPQGNVAYRGGITSPELADVFPNAGSVADVVRQTLMCPDKAFACVSPDRLAEAVRRRCGDRVAHWSEYLHARYGW